MQKQLSLIIKSNRPGQVDKLRKKDMTIQDLKNKKTEVVSLIELEGRNVKEIMTLMVEMLGCSVYENMTIAQYTRAIMKDNQPELKISDNTEYYTEASKRQLSSSLRK